MKETLFLIALFILLFFVMWWLWGIYSQAIAMELESSIQHIRSVYHA